MAVRAETLRDVEEPSPADLTIRLASVSDVTAIAELYGRISPASFAARFMTPRGPDSALLMRLAAFDPARGDVALLAVLPAHPATVLAEARFMPTGDRVAEFAMVVDDGVQGQGIGALMLARLLREAERRGVDRLSASVLVDNARMRRLLDRQGWALVQPCEHGVLEIEFSARGGMPGWPDDGRRRVLVESTNYFDGRTVARLRASGATVRRCPGPRGSAAEPGMTCPLVAAGTCRLAEQADEIIDLLPADGRYDAIRAEHRRRWPERLRGGDAP
jgi:GNAT superfamily N-acetyltransferase